MDEEEYKQVLKQATDAMLWILRTWARYEPGVPPAETPAPDGFFPKSNEEKTN